MSTAKATKANVLRRIEEVLRIRLDGAEFWDVREYTREKEQEAGSAWELAEGGKPLSDVTLWRYIGQADKLIADSCRSSRKKLIRNHLAVRRNLYAKAVAAGDYRTALSIKRDEAELLGIYPPKKIAPTTPDGKDEYPRSDSERDAAIEAILNAMRARRDAADTEPADVVAGGPQASELPPLWSPEEVPPL
jgi:hypothetical protein